MTISKLRLLPCFAALALGLLPMPAARALDRGPFSMQILIDGVPAHEHRARGRTYIEARAGREYAVRLTNRSGGRVAIALAVDGLNSIDARTSSAAAASKWILGPYESIEVDGWQVSTSQARRFFFTTEERSYGAWLGNTRNLGVISAVVFRERQPVPAPIYRPEEEPEAPLAERADEGSAAPSSRAGSRRSSRKAAPGDDLAATGIGRRIGHQVRRVRFDAEATPAATLQIRYEYRDALVRLGVLPPPIACDDDPLARRERARGFDDMGFAPDPPHRNR